MFMPIRASVISWEVMCIEWMTDLCEVHEVFEASVEVGLLVQGTDAPEMGVVDVSVHPEEALEYCLHYVHEVGGEGLPIPLWKQPRIVNLQSRKLEASIKYPQTHYCQCSKLVVVIVRNAARILTGSFRSCKELMTSYFWLQPL
jgi:hypothetical protein